MKNDKEYFKDNQSNESFSKGGELFHGDIEAIYDIPVTISAVLGRARMPINQILRLGRGAVVELDRKVGDSVEILANNRVIARGEVVIIDEVRLGITMTHIIKTEC